MRDRVILQKITVYCQRIADKLERYQIGELVAQLSDEVKQQNPAIPWRVIKDTRNFYVHAYGAIDIPSVWDTLNHDIPALKSACEAILSA